MIRLPPLANPEKDFCHFPKGLWYTSCQEPPQSHDKILLVRPGSIGDVLLLTPVIRRIRGMTHDLEITVATIHENILRKDYTITRFMKLENKTYTGLGTFGYNKVYWMCYEFTPNQHICKSYGDILGIDVLDYTPTWYFNTNEVSEAKKILKQAGVEDNFIAIHRECMWETRKWPYEKWCELVEQIQNTKKFKNFKILDIQQGREKSVKGTIQVTTGDIRLVAAMIRLAKGLVCIDSGPMHIATAVGTQTFSIFGVTNPKFRLPVQHLPCSFYYADHKEAGIHHKATELPAEFEPKVEDNPINYITSKEVLIKMLEVIQ